MPLIDDRKPFKRLDNATFLNSIRHDATSTYQERVPEATKANLEIVQDHIFSAENVRNEFVNALFNVAVKIARSTSFTNPLKKYKRVALGYGDRIEETHLGLANAYVYDEDRDAVERIIFGTETPEAITAVHRISREEMYKVTVDTALLKRAFYQDGGLSDFTSRLLQAQATSDEVDEFEAMMRMFPEYYERNGFWTVNVPDVSAPNLDPVTAEMNAKILTERVRRVAADLPFVDRRYNAARMPVAAKADSLVLYISSAAQSAVDVRALAAAFNTTYADMPFRTEVIPAEKFGIPGLQAILTTEDFLVVADTVYETTSIQVPTKPGMTNHFLHHHEIISVSPFAPAVLFSSTDPDSTLDPSPIQPSTSVTFDGIYKPAEADTPLDAGTAPEHATLYQLVFSSAPDAEVGVKLELVGNYGSFTYVSQTGALYVGDDEEAAEIVVRATALDNDAVFVEQTFTLDDEPVLVWPDGAAGTGAPAPVWAAEAAYEIGDRVTLAGGEVLQATVAGTSDVTEPAAPAAVGDTVTDGTVTWELIG